MSEDSAETGAIAPSLPTGRQLRTSAERRKILASAIGSMTVIALLVAGISCAVLFQVALQEAKQHLGFVVASQARLVEAVARFDRLYSRDADPGGASEATIGQLLDAHDQLGGIGETGEFVLAKLNADKISFRSTRRHAAGTASDAVPLVGNNLAEPMKRALRGQSGTMVGIDYRGGKVVAAFEAIDGLDATYGMVAKMDLAEVRAPFIRAALTSLAVAAVCVALGALAMLHMITPMLRQIEDREQRFRELGEAAQAATRAKGAFLANMSHEIRTPMNAIINLTQLCRKTELTNKQDDYLRDVEDASAALLGVINDILDVSKIESGKLSIERVPFFLDETLRSVSTLLSVKARKKNLEVLFHVASEVPSRLMGDPLRLKQVLTNLYTNAVKFTDDGEIVVTVKAIEVGLDDALLEFSIKDTGIGMSPSELDRLFKRFSQADSSTTRKFGGTGLGLTIVKELVELMHGTINVHSTPGEGSTFSFTARFGIDRTASDATASTIVELADKRALVVDDNATARLIFQEILEDMALQVTLAESAKEAIAILVECDSSAPYDVLILDWKMPGMDGLEAYEQIRAHHAIRHTPPAILATAYSEETSEWDVPQAGFVDVLAKPITASTLHDSVQKALGLSVVEPPRRSSQKSPLPQLQALRGTRVLLVEDNLLNQRVALALLSQVGVEVTLANNGREGVDALNSSAESEFDAVLMDVQMPEMDGYDATRAIRRQSRFEDLPIIAMTANAMLSDQTQARAAGMNDHVSKPIDANVLFETLERWVSGGG